MKTPDNEVTILVGVTPEQKGGADYWISKLGDQLGYEVLPFPALWRTYGRAAGPIRNRLMVQQHPDLVLAFRMDGESFGTDDAVEQAYQKDIPIIMINPKGEHKLYRKENEEPQATQLSLLEDEPEADPVPEWLGSLLDGEI